ncbi:uncharacterized protein [Euphorbia lathyris]|uniref:uncharacterized protein isoform X2 n=1 Tax=Euphorbia lathyris TaxID=212925 RepID=UPI0033143FE3
MHPNPNPSSNPQPSDPYYSSHPSYYSQNPSIPLPFPNVFPDPSAAPSTTDLRPPGVDSYPSVTAVPQVTQPLALSYQQADASGYYYDHNLQGWAAKEAVQQYGTDSTGYVGAANVSVAHNGMEQLALAQQAPTVWPNYAYQTQGNGNSNKRQKKTKVVQSAYCEVCKVDCNSKDVLDKHKLGKKHRKNLEKLQVAAAGPSVSSATNPSIGPQLDPKKATPSSIQRAKKKATTLENLETKRRKIVAGGAAQEAVRVCAICNVVCNSEGVYKYHLSGRKHATMMKKHMGGGQV